MDSQQHSQTALTAAAARAAHLIVDAAPHIFADTLAARLLGDRADELLAYHRLHGDHMVLASARAQAVVRSHFAEATVARAAESGAVQYVILGAGLDSYAYRTDCVCEVNVFEVDHPASQAFKRLQLAAAGIKESGHVTYVPVDFESDDTVIRLIDHGFDPARPAVVSWLGVSVYLTANAIAETLRRLASLAKGTELVFDYMLSEQLRDEDGQAYAESVGAHAAERGEPWRSAFGPSEMSALLAESGFAESRHFDQRDAIPANLWDRTDSLRPRRLSMIAHARR